MPRTAAPDLGWPFVGRAGELDAVLAGLTGPAEFAGIGGEAGIGKTRLLRAAAATLSGDGWDVSWLTGSAATATVPLATLAPLLASLPTRPTSSVTSADTFTAGAAAILARTRRARVAIVLDDAHLVDPVSAVLVEWASNETEASIAVATRPGLPLPQPLARLRQERPDAWLELEALDRDCVADVLGSALGGPVDGVTVEYVWQTTDGNALFVRELVAAGRRGGALRQVHGVWCWDRGAVLPPSLAGLVAQRLATLTPAARDAVEVVACGEPLPLPVLYALADADAVAELERGGLLAVSPQDGAVRPAHPMIGEAVRAGIGPLRAAPLYARLARTCCDQAGTSGDVVDELRVATWALAGHVEVDPALLLRAGRTALRRFDLRLAERLAVRATPAGGWPAEQLLAEVRRRQRRPDQVDELLDAAADVSAPVARRVRAAITAAGTLYWVRAEPERAATALSTVDGSDPAAMAMRAMLALFDGRTGEALRTAREALATCEDRGALVWLHSVATFAALCAGRYQLAIELADAGAALDREPAWNSHQLAWARCAALCGLGRLDESEATAAAGYADGARRRQPELTGGWAAFAGQVARVRGRLPDSTAYYREAAALLGEHDPLRLGGMCLVELALALAQEGRPAQAQPVLDDALRQLDGSAANGQVNRAVGAWTAQARAWIAFGQGQRRLAVRLLMHAAAVADAGGGHGTAAVMLHTVARFGEPELACDLLQRLVGVVEGPLPELFWRHAVALRGADATALDAVAADYAGLGAFLLAAEAARSAAAAHRTSGRAGSAALSAARADAWLDACGRPTTPTMPDTEPDPLTGRERAVLALAADGWSSRQIADHLSLSVRTVDNHLGRAYRKLGVAGRHSITR